MTNKENFEKQWDKFITRLKGKILKEQKKQELTYPLMKLILTDTKLDWTSEYDSCGRWLQDFLRENPQKGRLAYDILVDNMKFSQVTLKRDIMGIVSIAAPFAGVALGLGISLLCHAPLWAVLISTFLPAVLIMGAVKAISPRIKEKRTQEYVEKHLVQLEKYKNSVLCLLSD